VSIGVDNPAREPRLGSLRRPGPALQAGLGPRLDAWSLAGRHDNRNTQREHPRGDPAREPRLESLAGQVPPGRRDLQQCPGRL